MTIYDGGWPQREESEVEGEGWHDSNLTQLSGPRSVPGSSGTARSPGAPSLYALGPAKPA